MDPRFDVELVAVTKRYGATLAVDGVSLRIPRASYCCLLGPSGCGKTTTLRMIAGHEAITDGDILIDGANVSLLPPAARGTAMMFQSYALFPHLNCLDNVAFSLKMRGVAKAERHERARDFLRRVHMGDYAGQSGVKIIPRAGLPGNHHPRRRPYAGSGENFPRTPFATGCTPCAGGW